MRVSELGEFGLISRLQERLGMPAAGLIRGVGDDTAVLRSEEGVLWAYTVDALVEGVHFDLAYVPWHALGYKSLAVNISDLAAVGGSSPSYALVVIGLGGDVEVEALEEMYEGMRECGDEFSCGVVGGDIVTSPRQMFVSVSLVGSLPEKGFLGRGGARSGQVVMATGTLGDSYIGLRWLMAGKGSQNECSRRHLYPRPRLEEGRKALELGATACIDVSDGLLRDMGHICEESGMGADIYLDRLPISDAAYAVAEGLGEDAVGAAIYGGEDYELLLTVDESRVTEMEKKLSATAIGRIREGKAVRVLDSSGHEVATGRRGYEHFKEV